MFLTFKTKYSLGSLLFPSPNGDISFNHDDDSVVRKTAKVSVPVMGVCFFTLPLRNRIIKPLKMHFPAEIAVLKNNTHTAFRKHLWNRMVPGSADILIFSRTFFMKTAFYKWFYENNFRPFLLCTIPYFHVPFNEFIEIHTFVIYSPPTFIIFHYLSQIIRKQKRKR